MQLRKLVLLFNNMIICDSCRIYFSDEQFTMSFRPLGFLAALVQPHRGYGDELKQLSSLPHSGTVYRRQYQVRTIARQQ